MSKPSSYGDFHKSVLENIDKILETLKDEDAHNLTFAKKTFHSYLHPSYYFESIAELQVRCTHVKTLLCYIRHEVSVKNVPHQLHLDIIEQQGNLEHIIDNIDMYKGSFIKKEVSGGAGGSTNELDKLTFEQDREDAEVWMKQIRVAEAQLLQAYSQ